MLGQQRTRTLLGPADPVRQHPLAPPRFSARELIIQAEAAAEPTVHRLPSRPARRLVLVAATLVVATGAVGVLQGLDGTRDSPETDVQTGTVLIPVAYEFDRDAPPAGPQLRALATRLVDAEYDNQTGRFAYHHTRTWGDPVQSSGDGRHHMGYADETKTWQAADGSGREVRVPGEPQFPDEESREYFRNAVGPGETPSDDLLPPTSDPAPPLPTDRTGLRELLDAGHGAASVSKQVGTVYGRYVVPRPARAEILLILADMPGLRWRGEVTDRAGRTGVAVTFDDRANGQQHLLIFDPRTGALFAHEAVTLSHKQISAYQLLLRTGRTDSTD